ncbi:hypothetical protein SM0020_21071 [Sinorhizobium meliloti CCNWSX0020]|uniref:Uncharacterized protein n=1 Tax=Sinorhizobium meliloti CCNWSX0020 TaxID=1107881 RepID=H0G413_RHIML|nr:hypothetical protein SM0020_21071 [Sinorhizobium meliloti CCNWSX0020]
MRAIAGNRASRRQEFRGETLCRNAKKEAPKKADGHLRREWRE